MEARLAESGPGSGEGDGSGEGSVEGEEEGAEGEERCEGFERRCRTVCEPRERVVVQGR